MRQKRAPHDCQQLLEPAYPCATLLGGVGWLVSMAKVGLREPAILWLGYLTQELLVPCIMIVGPSGHAAGDASHHSVHPVRLAPAVQRAFQQPEPALAREHLAVES